MRMNAVVGNGISVINGKIYDPEFHILEQECKHLEIALLNLINELKKTDELIKNIEDYFKENHVILLPVFVN